MASTSKNSATGSQEPDNTDSSSSVLVSAAKRIKRIKIIVVKPDQVPIAVKPTSPEQVQQDNVVTEMVQVDNNNIESPADDSTSVLAAAPRKTRIIIVKPDQVPISVKPSCATVNNNIPFIASPRQDNVETEMVQHDDNVNLESAPTDKISNIFLGPELSKSLLFDSIDWKTFNFTSLVLWTIKDNGYDFAVKLGLQPITSSCKDENCNGETRLILNKGRRNFKCKTCKRNFSVKEGTILGKGAKFTWCQVLKFLYLSCTNLELYAIGHETGIASSGSQTEWASTIKECFEIALVNTNKEPIGGPGCIVEIEKSEHVTSSKKSSEKSAAMMFGGVCRNDGKVFMFPVENIDIETLKPIIKKWIKPGSTVVYQQWNASCSDWLENDKDYNCCVTTTSETSEKSQCHELHPEHDDLQTTNNVNTGNNVTTERVTSTLKRSTMTSSIRMTKENIGSQLAKHLYKKKFGWFEKSIGERFRILCVHVSKIYPGVGGRNAWRMIQEE